MPASGSTPWPISSAATTSGAALMVMSARPASNRLTVFWVGISTYSTSEKPSRRSSSSARYWGARQMAGEWTRRIFWISGGGSAAAVRGSPSKAAAPSIEVPASHSLRLNPGTVDSFMLTSPLPPALISTRLCLKFLPQLVEEAPVGAPGNNLQRTRLDHPRLVESEGVEAHRIRRVVVPPAGVGNLLDGLPA